MKNRENKQTFNVFTRKIKIKQTRNNINLLNLYTPLRPHKYQQNRNYRLKLQRKSEWIVSTGESKIFGACMLVVSMKLSSDDEFSPHEKIHKKLRNQLH